MKEKIFEAVKILHEMKNKYGYNQISRIIGVPQVYLQMLDGPFKDKVPEYILGAIIKNDVR